MFSTKKIVIGTITLVLLSAVYFVLIHGVTNYVVIENKSDAETVKIILLAGKQEVWSGFLEPKEHVGEFFSVDRDSDFQVSVISPSGGKKTKKVGYIMNQDVLYYSHVLEIDTESVDYSTKHNWLSKMLREK